MLAIAGCSAAPKALPSDASPEQVARRYFELLGAGDDDGARSLVWKPGRFDDTVRDGSLKGLTDLEVDPSREDTATGRPPEYLELATLRLLVVRYQRHTTAVTGEPPGQDLRFVLLGQEQPGGRWLVIETGTGP